MYSTHRPAIHRFTNIRNITCTLHTGLQYIGLQIPETLLVLYTQTCNTQVYKYQKHYLYSTHRPAIHRFTNTRNITCTLHTDLQYTGLQIPETLLVLYTQTCNTQVYKYQKHYLYSTHRPAIHRFTNTRNITCTLHTDLQYIGLQIPETLLVLYTQTCNTQVYKYQKHYLYSTHRPAIYRFTNTRNITCTLHTDLQYIGLQIPETLLVLYTQTFNIQVYKYQKHYLYSTHRPAIYRFTNTRNITCTLHTDLQYTGLQIPETLLVLYTQTCNT